MILEPGYKEINARVRRRYWIRGILDPGYEQYKGTRVQGYKGTRVQGYKGTRVRGYKGTRV